MTSSSLLHRKYILLLCCLLKVPQYRLTLIDTASVHIVNGFSHHIHKTRTNWRRGRLQKSATTKDRCVVHMCTSSVLSRRAASPAPAQRKNCRYFSTWSRWDHKKTISYFGDLQTGEVSNQHQVKKQKNIWFFASVRVSQLSTITYHVCHIYIHIYIVQKLHPTRTLMFILTWGGVWCGFLSFCWVPLPRLPWPIQINLITVGCSRVCVGLLLVRHCFNYVYWASSSLFAWASIATWRLLYCFVQLCGVRDRVASAVPFLSRKVATRLSEWVCCRRWSLEVEQWRCC